MIEGRRKLNLTMKVTDSVVRLTGIISNYSKEESANTVKKFQGWAEETRIFLKNDFDDEKAENFSRLAKPSKKNISPEEISDLSRIHADYLLQLIKETVS